MTEAVVNVDVDVVVNVVIDAMVVFTVLVGAAVGPTGKGLKETEVEFVIVVLVMLEPGNTWDKSNALITPVYGIYDLT